MGPSHVLMQSALDQWSRVEQLTEFAKQVLHPEDAGLVQETVQAGAGRALDLMRKVVAGDDPTDSIGDALVVHGLLGVLTQLQS